MTGMEKPEDREPQEETAELKGSRITDHAGSPLLGRNKRGFYIDASGHLRSTSTEAEQEPPALSAFGAGKTRAQYALMLQEVARDQPELRPTIEAMLRELDEDIGL